jgi:hypothetical protein
MIGWERVSTLFGAVEIEAERVPKKEAPDCTLIKVPNFKSSEEIFWLRAIAQAANIRTSGFTVPLVDQISQRGSTGQFFVTQQRGTAETVPDSFKDDVAIDDCVLKNESRSSSNRPVGISGVAGRSRPSRFPPLAQSWFTGASVWGRALPGGDGGAVPTKVASDESWGA